MTDYGNKYVLVENFVSDFDGRSWAGMIDNDVAVECKPGMQVSANSKHLREVYKDGRSSLSSIFKQVNSSIQMLRYCEGIVGGWLQQARDLSFVLVEGGLMRALLQNHSE